MRFIIVNHERISGKFARGTRSCLAFVYLV